MSIIAKKASGKPAEAPKESTTPSEPYQLGRSKPERLIRNEYEVHEGWH